MVTSVPSDTTITITMDNNETGSGATTSGSVKFFQYYHVGPAEQLGAFGWGIALWGGNLLGAINQYFKRSNYCYVRRKQWFCYRNYIN